MKNRFLRILISFVIFSIMCSTFLEVKSLKGLIAIIIGFIVILILEYLFTKKIISKK